VTLGIDLAGNYYLNRAPITKENAPALLKAAFDARPQDKVLFLKADRALAYSEVLAAMKVARDSGARVVAAVSEAPPNSDDEGGGN
jgi:biopolymer transport protein ExbD